MALTATERKRNQRARERAEKEKLAALQPTKEAIAARLGQHERDLQFAEELDSQSTFYKSECRSAVDLLTIYEGADINEKESDEDEPSELERKKKLRKKKRIRPNPSTEKISIRAISLFDNGIEVKFNPDQWEYETLLGEKINLRKLYEVDENVSFQRWLDLRDKARKNLFWLCNLLGRPMFHDSHQMICDMFVQKDFDGLFFEGYDRTDIERAFYKHQKSRFAMDGQTNTTTMMLFAPRGGRKSTIDGIDLVQWLLNCPETRVMIATAFRRLAEQLFDEIRGYFYMAQGADASAFQLLFPEYCLYGRAGSSFKIKCPAARLRSKEPHVWVTSMESSATGMRCDIRKLDDAVDYENSDTEDAREKLSRKIAATNDLVTAWGFTDVVGTRYFTKDWYGMRMSKDEDGNEPEAYNYMCIPAWFPKPEYRALYEQLLKEPNGMFKVTEDMVDLWWPQGLSFKTLRSKLKEKKEISFKNQQLNIATDPKEVDNYINQFDLETLRAHQYDRTAAPQGMEIIQCWDIAYSENSRTSDYSVGVTLGIYKNKNNEYCVVVIEVFFDKWKASELASNFIKYYEKHRPKVVYVENANGVKFLSDQITNYARLHASDIAGALRLRPVSNKPNAKRERIKDLEFLLGHDRLWFVSGGWIDETYKQLVEYKGGKSTATRKDDIPDAVSLGVTSHLPSTALQHNPDPKEVEKEYEALQEKARREAFKNRMFDPSSGTLKHPKSSPPPVTWREFLQGKKPPAPPAAPVAPQPAHPRSFPRAGSHAMLPSGWRGRPGQR